MAPEFHGISVSSCVCVRLVCWRFVSKAGVSKFCFAVDRVIQNRSVLSAVIRPFSLNRSGRWCYVFLFLRYFCWVSVEVIIITHVVWVAYKVGASEYCSCTVNPGLIHLEVSYIEFGGKKNHPLLIEPKTAFVKYISDRRIFTSDFVSTFIMPPSQFLTCFIQRPCDVIRNFSWEAGLAESCAPVLSL